MKRKDYMKPTTKFVQLRQRHHILTGSQAENVGVKNYKWNNIEEE